MSKMGTSNRKGRKSRRVLLLSLLLAVVLAVSGLVGAVAYSYGEFKIMVGGDETMYPKNSSLRRDWFVAKSAAEQVINFRSDRVFYATDQKTEKLEYWGWTQYDYVTDFYNVKSLKIEVKGAGPGQALQVEVEDKKVWQPQSNGTDTVLTYLGRSGLTRTQFNNLMGQISVRYTPSDRANAGGEATAIIYAYGDKSSVSGQPITSSYNGYSYNSHTCKLIFYRFAEGAVDEDSAEMDYKASYQANYDQTYEQAVGSLSNVRVSPDDSNQGRATFTMNITNPGTGGSYSGNKFGYEADIGYQIKESGRPWANDVRTVMVKRGVKLRNNSHVYDDINIEATGLNAGVTYAIRGVVITDGKATMPRYTNEITVSYQKPVISTFTTSNTTKVYEGGKDYMDITMATAFRDQNTVKENGTGGYTGLSYTDAYGFAKTGPWLKAQLYFTTNRSFTEEAVGGSTTQTTYGDDNSTWYQVGEVERKGLLDSNGTLATSFNKSWSLKLPATMDDILNNGDDTPINSTKCAYKLVVTDLYTGYSVYRYSDPFTIDSTPPTGTIIKGFGGDGVEMGMGLDTCDTNVVGGSNSKVSVAIGGASDGEGSGIKEYSYRMWYLPTKDGQALKDTREGVLRDIMSKYTSSSDCGTATYSEWSAAPFIQETDEEGNPVTNEDGTPKYKNRALVTVSKDGYYRVDAKAVDNAGKESTIVQAFFQVDLSAPETPKIALVKQNGDLITEGEYAGNTLYEGKVVTAANVKADPAANTSPYDNRTYTSSVIWLFAYSEPKAGKTLQTFEYSTDGGLTWTDFRPMTGGVKNADNSILETANVTGGKSVAYYPKGTYTGNGENFYYQGAVNVSGEGNDDYTAFLVRAKDTLGNVSLASEAAVMRTVGRAPQATSVLQHKGIEVALAIGNTSISSTTLTADLKNAAAKKINAKYYGEEGQGTDPKGENFNPWLYIKNFVDPTEQSYGKANVKMAGHNCNWESDASCTGACHGVTKGSDGNYMPATCPYAVLKNLGYEVYFPEMVNVQGVAGADANDTSQFQWTKFDHTMFNWMTYQDNSKDGGGATKKIQIPTVSYTSNTSCVTNLGGNPRYATYTYNGNTRYTASKDRVVYLGQTNANARDATTGLPTEDYNSATNSASPGTTLMQKWTGFAIWCWYDGKAGGGFPANGAVITAQKYQNGPYVTYTYRSIPAVDTYNAAGHWYKENNYDDWNAQGYGVKGWGEATIARRIYHILNTSASSDPVNGYSDLSRVDEVPMTTIAGYNGYLIASLRDWLFLYNDQSARKEISFSITDNQINAHSADFDGFLFNTTIRQNKAGVWRLSGYMFMHGDSIVETVGTPRPPTNYKWWIIKINDVNLEHFADGCLKTGGVVVSSHVDDDLPLYGITHPTASGPFSIPGGGSLQTIAYSEPDTTAVGTRHYKLITDTGKTTMYVFNTGNDTSYSYTTTDINKNLDSIWKKSDLASTAMPSGTTTSGYKAINWKQYYGSSTYIGTTLDTPRPTVDGLEIGSKEARTAGIHKDTNCYGFGPIVGARSAGHGCYIDSRVVYTNVKMRINVTRSLADVVNEPQWGGGQAKFIANISDDSTDDFEDPVLSSQIQWRLFTDQARFIGWGIQDFKDPTLSFIDRIEGDGTYEVNDIDSRGDAAAVQTTKLKEQVDSVATYITQEYYTSLGFDGTAASGTITSQAGEVMQAKGAVFTLNNAQQMKFSVTPEKYNTSTANPDFPSGRWYIVHDARGYQTVTDKTGQDAVTARYSDGLDLSITQPGRYTVYFAPDEAKVKAQTLNPEDAVFDFVVNTPPVAQFTGSLEGTKANPDDPDSVEVAPFTIKIEDSANDPDTNTLASDGTVPASNYSYTYRTYNEDGTYDEHTENFTGAPVGGIVRTEWRWEILDKQYNEEDETYTMKTIASSGVQSNGQDPTTNGWSTANPNGKTLEQLTNGHVSKQGWELYTDKPASFASLNSGAVLTVYQRVYDVSARRLKNADNADGSFGGYKFVAANNGNEETVSNVSQQNLASKQQITYAPLSAMSLSDVNLYTTSPDDSVITLERNSKQTQKRTDYEPSFYADVSGYQGLSGYQRLIEYTPTHDYYLASKTFYDKESARMDIYGAVPCTYKADTMEELTGAPLDNVAGERQGGYGVAADAEPVLKCLIVPSVSTEGQTIGQASGKWSISKNTVKSLSGSSGKLAIQLCETIQGLTQQDYKDMEADDSLVINPHDITGSSARTINYNQDKTVPTGTKVTAVIELWDEEAVNEDGTTGAWVETEYQANNYLDVTGGKARIKIHADGAKDGEGSVAGYGYYFYTKSQVSKNTSGVSDALYESAIYYLAKDADGNLKLTQQPIVYNGVTYDVAAQELDSTSAWNKLTDDQKTAAIKEARKQAIAKSEPLPGDGGDIIISMDAIGLGEPDPVTGKVTPTASLNVAIFAYDNAASANATPVDSLTGSNESQKSRMEGIKLSTSEPMPPVIIATDTNNAKMAYIGNDSGYTDAETTDKAWEYSFSASDASMTVKRYAGTDVTVQFNPRKARFAVHDQATGLLEHDENGNEYYEDIYHNADLTGTAEVLYTVLYKASESGTEEWRVYQNSAGEEMEGLTMPSAQILTFTEEGCYQVTGQIVNGAGVASETRTVEFIIDKTAPDGDPNTEGQNPLRVSFVTEDGQPYVPGTCAKTVTMYVEPASDTNGNHTDAYFEYTRDGGQTWHRVGSHQSQDGTVKASLSDTQSEVFGHEDWDAGSGDYTVRVRAVDPAGNVTYGEQDVNVRIDRTAPEVRAPSLKVDSTTEPIYGNYVISLKYYQEMGSVYSIVNGGKPDYISTEVMVTPGGEAVIYFHPQDGKQLGTVTCGGKAYTADDLMTDPDHNDDYYLTLENVQQDYTVDVTFENVAVKAQTFMMRARSSFEPYFAAMPALYEAEPAAQDGASGTEEAGAGESGGTDAGESGETGETGETGGTGDSGETETDPARKITVQAFAGSGGYIDMDGQDTTGGQKKLTVAEGDVVHVTITMVKGYTLSKVTMAGREYTDFESESALFKKQEDGSYVGDITVDAALLPADQGDDLLIMASFEEIKERTLRVTWSDSGSVSLVGYLSHPVHEEYTAVYQVAEDSDVTFQMKPQDAKYWVKSLVIDGVEVTKDAAGTMPVYKYHVPKLAEGDENKEIVAHVKFDVQDLSDAFSFDVSALVSTDGEFHGSIFPSGTAAEGTAVLVPASGSRTFTITPEPRYRLKKLWLSQMDTEGVLTAVDVTANVDKDTGKYTLEASSDGTLEAEFELITYSIGRTTTGKGTIGVALKDPQPGESLNLNNVPVGRALVITAEPSEGYQLVNLEYETDSTTYQVGAVSRLVLENGITGNTTIKATFTQRQIDSNKTTHSITATADYVKDNESLLAAEPYRFRIMDASGKNVSAWTPWSSKNYYTFYGITPQGSTETIPLKPNAQYFVELQARDNVGNISSEMALNGSGTSTVQKPANSSSMRYIYTKANQPSTNGARAIDTADSYTKDVALGVKANGNPDSTEYLVYYSESSTMADMKVANLPKDSTDPDAGWSVLTNGEFIVTGLTPGVKYYLQVVARNEEGEITDLDPNDITSITVSPAAPPENSLWFEEQESPVGGVKLTWDLPAGSVTGVVIYRESEVILDRDNVEDLSFVDTFEGMNNTQGDAIYNYSYAFKNDAGVGSTRQAISKEYHDMLLAVSQDETDLAAKARLDAADALERKGGEEVFSEALMYPVFPTGVRVIKATAAESSSVGTDHSGVIQVRVNSSSSRNQKYFLTLKAYEKMADGSYSDPIDGSLWDPDGTWHNADGSQKWNETMSTSSGATATWNNLASAYEYRVFVEEIRSTGAVSGSDGYGGERAGTGVEGLLRKTYIVNEDGYKTEFRTTDAEVKSLIETAGLATVNKSWAVVDGAKPDSDQYTSSHSEKWDSPLSEYIGFNKTPHVKLASDPYVGNSQEKIREEGGNKYLLIDDGMEDQRFTLKVSAWDPDGYSQLTNHATPYVEGEINKRTTGRADLGIDPADPNAREPKPMPKLEIWNAADGGPAEKPDAYDPDGNLYTAETNPYTVTFDADSLATGEYTNAVLRACDGETVAEEPNALIHVLVNHATPVVTLKSGVRQQIEKGSVFDLKNFEIAASVAKESSLDLQEGQNRVAVKVMPEQYQAAFGSSDYNTILGYLTGGREAAEAGEEVVKAALAKAKELLDKDADKYVDTTHPGYPTFEFLTREGAVWAMGRVAPPVEAYVEISEADYNSLYASFSEAQRKALLRKETEEDISLYWLQWEEALNRGLCSWMAKQADGSAKVTGEAGKAYYLELVASVGGNQAATPITFEVKNAPSVSIVGDQRLGWTTTDIETEYEDYKNRKVSEIQAKYADIVADGNVVVEDVADPANTEAGRPTDRVDEKGNQLYEIYTMYDTKARVSTSSIQSSVEMEFGVYNQFDEVGVLFSTEPPAVFNPNRDPIPNTMIPAPVQTTSGGSVFTNPGNNKTIVRPFSKGGLERDEEYYLWSYFKIKAENSPTGEEVIRYSTNYRMITTESLYAKGYYSFESYTHSVAEKNYLDSPVGSPAAATQQLTINRSNCDTAGAKLHLAAKYYQADEFGNIVTVDQKDESGNPVLDEEGNPVQVPVEITGEQLAWAKQAVTFSNGSDSIEIDATKDMSRVFENLQLRYQPKQQGHMVVRVVMTVVQNLSEHCYTVREYEYTDIYVEDKESLVSTFVLGVKNQDSEGKPVMTEIMEGEKLSFYEYQFKGLPNEYTDLSENRLTVKYVNKGTGDLTGITAAVYEDQAGTKPSTRFEVSLPSKTYLTPESKGGASSMPGSVTVKPVSGLEDGVYDGWLFLSAEHMAEKDVVKIHLYQVVGQSTLRGRVYITPEKPSNSHERTGVSTVYLYDSKAVFDRMEGNHAVFNQLPAYTTKTDETGFFTIENIVNQEGVAGSYGDDKTYFIVVERDGFVTMNGGSNDLAGALETISYYRKGQLSLHRGQSRTYEFNLRLLGGDVDPDQDQKVRDGDLETLISYYNQYYNPDTEAQSEEEKILRRCDFNQDSVVNALDRFYLILNMGSSVTTYGDAYAMLEPEPETE